MPFKLLSEVWWFKQQGDIIIQYMGVVVSIFQMLFGKFVSLCLWVTSPLVPGKSGWHHHKTIDLYGGFVSSHQLWFSLIFHLSTKNLDEFLSGLQDCVKQTNLWNMTISPVHSIIFHPTRISLPFWEICRPRCNNKGGITRLGPQNPSKIHQHNA